MLILTKHLITRVLVFLSVKGRDVVGSDRPIETCRSVRLHAGHHVCPTRVLERLHEVWHLPDNVSEVHVLDLLRESGNPRGLRV